MTNRNAESMGTFGAEWEYQGFAGKGNVKELIGSLAGRPAIVAGNGYGVFDEVADARAKLSDAVVVAVNDCGMFLPSIDHFVSLHADNLGAWKAVRWLTQHARESTKYHSATERPVVDYLWEGLTPLYALSGYFAMQIAHIMGAGRIVLCGCPGDATRRFFEVETGKDYGQQGIREQIEREMRRLPALKASVCSMTPGSWTHQMFGGL